MSEKKYLATDGTLSTLLNDASSAGSMVVDFLMQKNVDSVEIKLGDGRCITIEPSDHIALADFIKEHFP